mmetsp:Transcript_108/g.122  ORF Transcript_108/g.122 Transcript_108/m.122 type:complete len:103 (-) Transcript_108:843-1151(-)
MSILRRANIILESSIDLGSYISYDNNTGVNGKMSDTNCGNSGKEMIKFEASFAASHTKLRIIQLFASKNEILHQNRHRTNQALTKNRHAQIISTILQKILPH